MVRVREGQWQALPICAILPHGGADFEGLDITINANGKLPTPRRAPKQKASSSAVTSSWSPAVT